MWFINNRILQASSLMHGTVDKNWKRIRKKSNAQNDTRQCFIINPLEKCYYSWKHSCKINSCSGLTSCCLSDKGCKAYVRVMTHIFNIPFRTVADSTNAWIHQSSTAYSDPGHGVKCSLSWATINHFLLGDPKSFLTAYCNDSHQNIP